METSIFLVEDNVVMREGLRALLGAQSDIVVVGYAPFGDGAVLRLKQTRPAVVILDASKTGTAAIEMTRSRPNHKNDNQYIEERNGHIVRKFAGYQRLDIPETVDVLNQLYDILSVYLNHFVAVRKCLKKERIGSKYKLIYDKPRTPYQRLLEQKSVSKSEKDKLITIHKQANLWELKQQVELKIQKLYDIEKRYGNHK